MSELYEGQQFVGMDLHRRRSVLVRMTETGEHLETVRILNDRDVLAEVMSRAGESPEVVLAPGQLTNSCGPPLAEVLLLTAR